MENTTKKAWYVVQTYSGMEAAVKRNIDSRTESMNMGDYIFDVFIAEQKVIEKNKKGVLVEKKVQMYPGYIFINMIVTNDTWFMVRNTPMVTGFLGSSGGGAQPVPVPDEEMIPILKSCGITKEEEHLFNVGDDVAIIAGTFAGQFGKIDSVDYEKHTVKVLIDFFGRPTPAELDFLEIKVK